MAVASYDKAGQHAREEYRTRNRAWLKRVWWAIPLIVAMLFCVVVGFALVVDRGRLEFWTGVGVGAGVALAMALASEPPPRIANWQRGWEGERATGKALRALPDEWQVLHDVPAFRGGNHDHIVVGPAGVFLLETKNFTGIQRVLGDTLTVSWIESPDEEAWSTTKHARSVKRRARELSDVISADGERVWVYAVMVLWGSFPERRVDASYLTWTHGSDVTRVIRSIAERKRQVVDVERATGRLRDPALAKRPRSTAPPV